MMSAPSSSFSAVQSNASWGASVDRPGYLAGGAAPQAARGAFDPAASALSPTKSGSSIMDALKERERRSKDALGPSSFDPAPSEPAIGMTSGTIASGYNGSVPLISGGAATMPTGPSGDRSTLMPVAPLAGPVPMSSVGIAPVPLDLTDLRKFLISPAPRGAGVVQCYIERDRSGITGKMYPTFSLFLKEGNRFLMAARKRTKNKTSNYLMSMDKRDLNRESASFVGKLRSNFVGTEFVVYDDGEAPDKVKGSDTALRQEIAVITYASNILGSRGPRKMKVGVPKVTADGRRVVFQPEKCVMHRDPHVVYSECPLTDEYVQGGRWHGGKVQIRPHG
jgi:hypothetical protein